MSSRANLILDLTFDFSLHTIAYCERLNEQKKYVISTQLLKSATSIGANVREAQDAESRQDFIHKLKIALKEATETIYWLELCSKSEYYPDPDGLNEKAVSIKKVLVSIIRSCSNQK